MDSKKLRDSKGKMRAMLDKLPPDQRRKTISAITIDINARNRMIWDTVKNAYELQMAKVALYGVVQQANQAIKNGWRDDEAL